VSAALGGNVQVVKYLVACGAEEGIARSDGWTPILVAANKGHEEVVAYLLGRPGIDIEAKTTEGDRAIDVACRMGHLQMVKLLVAAGVRIDPQDSDEIGALAEAAVGGHLQVVKYLVEEAGADEGRTDGDGKTPLIWAADEGHVEVVEYLLGRPATDVNAKTTDKVGALTFACCRGHLEVVKLLVEAGARVDAGASPSNKLGALVSAAFGGNVQVVKYLLGRTGVDIEAKTVSGERALDVACRGGHLEVVKLLVAEGARVDPQDSYTRGALAEAAVAGHLHVVKYLVEEAGADERRAADLFRTTPLLWAADEGQAEIVAYLLGRPGGSNEVKGDRGCRAVDFACRKGHLEVVKLLVGAGARVIPRARDVMGSLASAIIGGHLQLVRYLVEEAGADERRAGLDGRTPLILAADKGDADIMAYLLDRSRVNIDAKAANGDTALEVAYRNGHLEVVKLLVAAGARVNPQSSDEHGVLMTARLGGNVQVVRYLVEEAGADEQRVGPGGKVFLMAAADLNRADIVEYLLGRPGIDIERKSAAGWTALNIACREGHLEVVKMLVGAGARVDAQGSDGQGALMTAIDHLEVVKYLVEEAGADVNAITYKDDAPTIKVTACDLALRRCRWDVARYLVDHGADLSLCSTDCTIGVERSGDESLVARLLDAGLFDLMRRSQAGLTPLHSAATFSLPMVKLLVSAGADVEAQNSHGRTPLMCAACDGRLDVVKWLVEAGADLNAKDKRGQTARELAKSGRHASIVEYLQGVISQREHEVSSLEAPIISIRC
jgi:ankyrin repeat protein